MTSTATADGPVATEMRRRLTAELAPTRLDLVDESASHAGHAGHDGRGESHFSLIIEAPSFARQSRIQRQRAIYAALGDLMQGRIHALSIKASAPGE